jgi:hypothetical protein
MPFELVYHDSALPQEKIAEVHNWRISEAVVSEALPLSNLSYVICRSTHEERTLRYALGSYAAPKIIVEQKGSIFMRRGMFIDEIYWASNLLNLQFHAPTGFTKENYKLKVTCWDNQQKRRSFLSISRKISFPKYSILKRRDLENRDRGLCGLLRADTINLGTCDIISKA